MNYKNTDIKTLSGLKLGVKQDRRKHCRRTKSANPRCVFVVSPSPVGGLGKEGNKENNVFPPASNMGWMEFGGEKEGGKRTPFANFSTSSSSYLDIVSHSISSYPIIYRNEFRSSSRHSQVNVFIYYKSRFIFHKNKIGLYCSALKSLI